MEILFNILTTVTLFLSAYFHLKNSRESKRKHVELKRLKRINIRLESDKFELEQDLDLMKKSYHDSESKLQRLYFENKRLNDIVSHAPEEEDDYSDEELADLIKNSEYVI